VQLATLAAHYRIPAAYPTREVVEIGGLMSYGTDLLDIANASAPQRLAGRPYCLGSTVDSDRSESVDSTRDKSLSKLDVGVGL
jgi:hypothetical protein